MHVGTFTLHAQSMQCNWQSMQSITPHAQSTNALWALASFKENIFQKHLCMQIVLPHPTKIYVFNGVIYRKVFFHVGSFTKEKAQKSGLKIPISLRIRFSMHLNSTQFDSILLYFTLFYLIQLNASQLKLFWLNSTVYNLIWLSLTQFD
jgi:hypothetical protein